MARPQSRQPTIITTATVATCRMGSILDLQWVHPVGPACRAGLGTDRRYQIVPPGRRDLQPETGHSTQIVYATGRERVLP